MDKNISVYFNPLKRPFTSGFGEGGVNTFQYIFGNFKNILGYNFSQCVSNYPNKYLPSFNIT